MVKSTAMVSHKRSALLLDILRGFNELQLETRKLRTVTILSIFLNSLLLIAYTVSSGAKPATSRFSLAKNSLSSTVTSLVRHPAENPLLLAPFAVSLLVTAFLTTTMKRLGKTFSPSLWKTFACSTVVHVLLVDSLLPVIDAGVLIITVDHPFFVGMLVFGVFAVGFCSFAQLRLWWLEMEALQKAGRITLNGSKRKIEYWFAVNFSLAPWQVMISVHCLISCLIGCTNRFERLSEIVLAFLLTACSCGMAWFQQLSYILECFNPEEEDDACMARGLGILQTIHHTTPQ